MFSAWKLEEDIAKVWALRPLLGWVVGSTPQLMVAVMPNLIAIDPTTRAEN